MSKLTNPLKNQDINIAALNRRDQPI